MALSADVLIVDSISTEEAARLAEDFETIGLVADFREVSSRRSIGELGWLILAAIPLKSFFDQLTKEFASDSYKRFKTAVGSILQRKRISANVSRTLLLHDTITGVEVLLEPDLPVESYRQLMSLDLSTLQGAVLHYDLHRSRWCSGVDEVD